MKDMWMMWDRIEENNVDEFNFIAEQYPLINASIGQGEKNKTDQQIRRSQIRWVKDDLIKNKMMEYAKVANRSLWNFDINYMDDVQHTRYHHEDHGHYDWHVDIFWDNKLTLYDRKISVIIQLTDGDEYEGGDFLIDPQYVQPPKDLMRKKGTVFAFPSFIRHKVEPVTAGTRKSFVTWIEGPAFR
tara:strand:+ start:262 stop:819 length:558 start_codon:yes stop_codon:yes gene_type:complete